MSTSNNNSKVQGKAMSLALRMTMLRCAKLRADRRAKEARAIYRVAVRAGVL